MVSGSQVKVTSSGLSYSRFVGGRGGVQTALLEVVEGSTNIHLEYSRVFWSDP